MTNNMFGILSEQYEAPVFLHEKISENYKILSCLKHTEERQVYLLCRLSDNENFILKCGTGMNGELLKREFDIVGKLRKKENEFSAILKPVDYFYDNGRHFYIREYAEGRTLASMIEKGVRFSEKEICRIMALICEQVYMLHSQNPSIICRDINPQNVIISSDGTPKIIDLDSLREYDKSASSDTICIGTKEMAAPEQFGYTQTDVRTDIYVLGMLLVYISTGTYDKYIKMPAHIAKIVAKSTSFNPEDRYASALHMKKALINRHCGKILAVIVTIAAIAAFVALGTFLPPVTAHSQGVQSQTNASTTSVTTTTTPVTTTTTPVTTTTTPVTTTTTSVTTTTPVTTTTTPVTTTTTPVTTTTTPVTTTTTPVTTTTTSITTTTTPVTTTTAAYSVRKNINVPKDGEWHEIDDGAFAFHQVTEGDLIPYFELDEWIPVDWSEIKMIAADVSIKNGLGECIIDGIKDERYCHSDPLYLGTRPATVYLETEGKQIEYPRINFWWANSNTTIIVENIRFSTEEYDGPTEGRWNYGEIGVYTYNNFDKEASGHIIPPLRFSVNNYGIADPSKVKTIKLDIETDGKLTAFLGANIPDATLSDPLKIDQHKHTLTLNVDGKMADKDFAVYFTFMSADANVKVDNVRLITE